MTERSARREPMVWLMIGLPAFSVVVSAVLLAAALQNGGAVEVSDRVESFGEIQVAELGPDERAQSLKLSAVLRVEDAAIDVLPVSGGFARDQALILILVHPTDATQDRRLVLQPSEFGWRIIGDVRVGHDWIAQLAPSDQRWRLHGRLKTGQRVARLGSAFAGD